MTNIHMYGGDLPPGTSSSLQGISENFQFHASPQKFILQQIQHLYGTSDYMQNRMPVRARILNRNVVILSSNSHIRHVLGRTAKDEGNASVVYDAELAYRELMAPFFPPPNLLLAEPVREHAKLRPTWEHRMQSLHTDKQIRAIVHQHFSTVVANPGSANVYETMKALAWKILLATFLNLQSTDAEFQEIMSLQENLLRGQFSLLPVSINFGFWQSPRKRGIEASKKLQSLILDRLRSQESACPFVKVEDERELKDLASHVLLFTSSLAAKAMASLLTAFFLNLLFAPSINGGMRQSLADSEQNVVQERLWSVLQETQRLSPPIVGVMRRAIQDDVLSSEGTSNLHMPQGWEAWLYFVGGGRDSEAYGDQYDMFDPFRFDSKDIPEPLGFGLGPKSCLGKQWSSEVIVSVADECFRKMKLRAEGRIDSPGVHAWLGWKRESDVDLQDWADAVKQLPTQHPAEPIFLRFLTR